MAEGYPKPCAAPRADALAEGCEHPNAENPLCAWAKDGLFFCDTYSVTRVSRSCRELRPLTLLVDIWKPRLQQLCSFWSLPYKEERWREQYLSLFRPRWDGIYVGYCQYLHKVRPGASMTQKGSSVWITYRRYLRFFPPDDYGTLWALVLQDAAPLEVAVQSLLATPTPVTGDGFAVGKHAKEAKHHLEKKIFTGQYTFREGMVDLNYTCELGECTIRLRVDHAKPGHFSEQMAWVEYSATKPGEEPLPFDLGRNEWGCPRNPACDHFPDFLLLPQASLEHHL